MVGGRRETNEGEAVQRKTSWQSLIALHEDISIRQPATQTMTHSQLREARWFLGWLLVRSVHQGGDDSLPMAKQVHLQYLQAREKISSARGGWARTSVSPSELAMQFSTF